MKISKTIILTIGILFLSYISQAQKYWIFDAEEQLSSSELYMMDDCGDCSDYKHFESIETPPDIPVLNDKYAQNNNCAEMYFPACQYSTARNFCKKSMAEPKGQRQFPYGTDIWHAFSVFVPTDFNNDPDWNLIYQFHSHPDDNSYCETNRSPPFAIRIEDDLWRIFIRRETGECIPNVDRNVERVDVHYGRPVLKGEWNHFVINIRFDYKGDGRCQVWLKEGENDSPIKLADYQGLLGFNDERAPYDYASFGYYYGNTAGNDVTLYFDRVIFAGPDETLQSMMYSPQPIVDFSVNKNKGVAPLTVNFEDNSTTEVINWLWDFGDGNTSSESNPTHTYTDEGTYSVSLKVTDESGTESVVKEDFIVVGSSSTTQTNNRPTINPQIIDIEEDATNGEVVGNVNANDAEEDNLTYSIESGNPYDVISIDSNTGDIEINNSQLLSSIEDFEVVFRVSDGSLSNSATFEFHVLKKDEVNYGTGSVIQVNINAYEDLQEWNELILPNAKINDLTYINGNKSEVDFEIWGEWTGSTGGDVTGDCFPTDVIQNYVFTSDNTVRYFTFSELDGSKLYDIDILCSRNTGATNERGAIFFIGGDSDSIDAKGNTCELVTFKGIKPKDGVVQIGYRKRLSDSDGHVNAFIIRDSDNKSGEMSGSSKDNTAPIVVMHYEEAANSGTLKTLDASGSFDPDNESLTYRWIVPNGISVSSENASKITYLVPDVIYPETNSFVVEVTDGIDTSYKSLNITFTPFNPNASEVGIVSVESSFTDGDNHPVNLLDGSTSTYWSAEGDNQWFSVELETPTEISHLKLSFHDMEAKRSSFDILLSVDGETWDILHENLESCGFSSAMHLIDCSNQEKSTYKYIKINGHGTDVDAQNSFSELKVYGISMGATSIFEEEKQQFNIYPNPASQYFNIELAEQSTVSVFDISGRNVYESYFEKGEHRISVCFPNGCYIISVKSKNYKYSNQKLIIN